jgi:hypothetical protein
LFIFSSDQTLSKVYTQTKIIITAELKQHTLLELLLFTLLSVYIYYAYCTLTCKVNEAEGAAEGTGSCVQLYIIKLVSFADATDSLHIVSVQRSKAKELVKFTAVFRPSVFV